MITINTNKGLITVESWDDIITRPGFNKSLDPNDKKLDSIIGRYMFKDKINCGLSNCHKPHGLGYIVSTKDGYETNIGKDCGKKYFGVDFNTLSRKFERDITEKENREKLFSFMFQVEELEERIHSIRKSKNGADWANKFSKALITLNRGCPNIIVQKITNMVKTRNGTLTIQREATKQEIEDIEIIENRKVERPHYIDEPIANISGIEILYDENNLRELLIKDLETNTKALSEKDIDQMSFVELGHWSKWIGTIENILEQSEKIVGYGKKLLNKENLNPFMKIIDDRKDQKLFKKFMEDLSNSE